MPPGAVRGNRLRGHAWISEVCPGELDPSGFDMSANVFQLTAGEVVDDPHSSPTFDKSIDYVRPDEGGAACYERLATAPVHL